MPFIYRTELMNKVLESPQAQRIITYMSPLYGEAYTMLWLIQAVGIALDLQQKWADDYIEQVFPQTATWSLDKWEEEYQLIAGDRTLEQRRQAVIAKENPIYPMNPRRLTELVESIAGVSVRIVENLGKNRFGVVFCESPEQKPHYDSKAFTIINQYKPSHLIYDSEVNLSPVGVINPESVKLLDLSVHVHVDNFGLNDTTLNGQRLLDGSWPLTAKSDKGLLLKEMGIALRNKNKRSNQGSMKYFMSYRSRQDMSAAAEVAVNQNNRQSSALSRVDMYSEMKNKSSQSAVLISDSMYHFDGTVFLDGTRRLNAEIVKEVIV